MPGKKLSNSQVSLILEGLAAAKPRFGYQRLTILLRREGWHVNRKRVHRPYMEKGLQLRVKAHEGEVPKSITTDSGSE